MSYPYGPEPYPTFGTVEGDVDAVSTACWTDWTALRGRRSAAPRHGGAKDSIFGQ